MSFDRSGKAVANESKHPFIVEVPVAASGLGVELNRQIVGFHTSRRIPPRFGRAGAFPIWGRAPLPRTFWGSVLQKKRHLVTPPPLPAAPVHPRNRHYASACPL